ncbi:MAG: ABC transporter permease [Elusimicrobia bacterium]|nr:ABC transporter permease [Elusimicrobiota bacterium]
MKVFEALRTGFREIRAHKSRSALSFSAVAIGVASMLYTFAQTHGMNREIGRAIGLIGPGRLSVEAKKDYVSKGLSPGLTADDALEIRLSMPELYMVYPSARHWIEELLVAGRKFDSVLVMGTTPDWAKRDWVYTQRGRWLSDLDLRQASRVCVVIEPGGWVKKPFWASWMWEGPFEGFLKRHDMLGKDLILGGHSFRVVGALRDPPADKDPRWGRYSEGNVSILMPVTAMHSLMFQYGQKHPRSVDSIQVDTGNEKTLPAAKRMIASILKRRHKGEDDFEIKDSREEIEGQLKETAKYTLAATLLGAVAILAGGIGILNVTLAALFARVKEIGIRRAVGATRLDILSQFVAEAMLLGLCGGVAGSALGAGGIAYLARHTDRDLASLTWYHFAAALALAGATGFFFSLYPAWKAAALDPVEALRDE